MDDQEKQHEEDQLIQVQDIEVSQGCLSEDGLMEADQECLAQDEQYEAEENQPIQNSTPTTQELIENLCQQQFATRKQLYKALPSQTEELQQLAATLLIQKQILREIAGREPTQLNNREKTEIVNKLQGNLPKSWLRENIDLKESSYYNNNNVPQQDKYKELRKRIKEIFAESHNTYGHRRIKLKLKNEGSIISEKVIATIMRGENLIANTPVQHKSDYSSYKGELGPTPSNLHRRPRTVDEPNLLWATDITQFKWKRQELYLSVMIDLHDEKVVAYTVANKPTVELTQTMLENAIQTLPPEAQRTKPLIIHSDHGHQYFHQQWIDTLKEHGILRSMSTKGKVQDNPTPEAFFGIMKIEMYHHRKYHTRRALEEAIHEYISFYNNERIKSKLGTSIASYRQAMGIE